MVSDNCYPWEGSVSECRVPRYKKPMDARCPSSNFIENDELHRVGPVYRLGTQEDIMYEIVHSGPVQGNGFIFIQYVILKYYFPS